MDKAKQYIIVTGGSRGIGLAIVKKFLDEGYSVIIIAKNINTLEKVKNNLQKIYTNQDIQIVSIDLADKIAINEGISRINFENKEVLALINNAGIFIGGSILKEEDYILESMLNINLLAPYYISKLITPYLLKASQGHIINISSIAGLKAYDNGSSYSITKYALNGFSDNLRNELKDTNIKVSTVYPGPVWTDSWKNSGLNPDDFIQVEDIADIVLETFQKRTREFDDVVINVIKD